MSDTFASLGAVGTPSFSFDGDTDTGMWSSGADILNWSTGGTERMEIGATGSFLLTSASLELRDNTPVLLINANSTTASLHVDGHTSNDALIDFKEAGTTKFVAGHDASESEFKAIAGTSMTGNTGMTLTEPYGWAGFGVTPSHPLHVYFNNSSGVIARIENPTTSAGASTDILLECVWSGDTDPTNSRYARFGRSGANEIGSISAASASSVAYNTTSDIRLKDVTGPLEGALEKLSAIDVVNFTWKEDGTASSGFLAQNLYEIYPEPVTKPTDEEETNWSMDYGKMTPLLAAAIKELRAENDNLKARLEALENA